MFNHKFILAILLLLTYSMPSYSENDPGFDEICRVYTDAHEVVMYANAKSRYALFKGSAEHTLKRSWDCKAMKAVMDMQVE